MFSHKMCLAILELQMDFKSSVWLNTKEKDKWKILIGKRKILMRPKHHFF